MSLRKLFPVLVLGGGVVAGASGTSGCSTHSDSPAKVDAGSTTGTTGGGAATDAGSGGGSGGGATTDSGAAPTGGGGTGGGGAPSGW